MYITIRSIKKTLGKFIELTDLYIGLPMLFIFLTLFAFTNLKIEALMFLGIAGFLMIPINISKKNRMYKVMFLLARYVLKTKNYCYFNEEIKESKVMKLNELIKRRY